MLSKSELYQILPQLSSQSYKGEGYLSMNINRNNILRGVIYLQKTFSGASQYNIRGKQTIYLANSINTLYQQITNNYCLSNSDISILNALRPIRVFYSFNKLLDLTDSSIQEKLETNVLQLKSQPQIVLGNVARDIELEALKVPINLDFYGYYLVIFRENLLPQSIVDIDYEGKTIALNYNKISC